jgi:HK97 family phage major capsid protein
MTLDEILGRENELKAREAALCACDDITAEQLAELDAIQAELNGIPAKLQEAQKAEHAAKLEAARKNAATRPLNGVAPQRRGSLSAAAPSSTKPQWLSDPKKGFTDHRDFLMTVMDASVRGYTDDARLKYLSAGSDEQSTVADPYGGFLVPEGFSPNVMKVMAEMDPIATYGNITKIPMTNAVVPINARVDKNHTSSVSGGFTVGRRSETQTGTSSRQQYEQVVLNAQSLFGIAYATEELLARSPVSFAAIIEAGFRDEFPAKKIDERLNGTGTGQFEGVINCPATVSVSKETGQAAATILYENVIKMRSRCWGYAQAIWLANHDCLPQLMLMNQSIGTGGNAVWQPSARDGEPDRLFGRPIFFTEFTKTVGTVGDIVLGNWTQYLEGTLTPMQSAESMHVRFENHERTFKFWEENDGRCWWRSALTPKNSTTTLSPFVTLATRA